MLNCTLAELPVTGVVWTFVVCGFVFFLVIVAAVFYRFNGKVK